MGLFVVKGTFRGLLLISFPLIVFAHRVDLFPNIEGNKLEIWGYYSDGTPTKGADVKIFSSNGSLLFEGKTDKEGHLIWQLPTGVSKIKIVLYAGLGHKAETTLALNSNPPPQKEKISNNQTEVNISEPSKGILNEQKPKEQIPWFKAFCGIGWILAIFGLWNLYLNWKGNRSRS